MKFLSILLMALLAISIPACSAAEAATEASIIAPGNGLGMYALEQLCQSSGNAVVSPASLAIALTMAAEGAQGDTRAQLVEILAQHEVPTKLCGEYMDSLIERGVKLANAMVTCGDIEVLPGYSAALVDKLHSEIFSASLDDIVSQVNEWASAHTDGMIAELLTTPPDAELSLMLLNAILMEAEWTEQFMPSNTIPQQFYGAAGETIVDMMHQTAHFNYVETSSGTQIVNMPYSTNGLSMYVLLPGEGKLPELLAELSGISTFEIDGLIECKVELSLPRVSLESSNELKKLIIASGADIPFGAESDFSGINGSDDLFIDSVLQKARIDVYETGTSAAAVTAVAMNARSAMPAADVPPVEMNVNRPYLMLVTDDETGWILFAAAVIDIAE